jgi:hypothetical protein
MGRTAILLILAALGHLVGHEMALGQAVVALRSDGTYHVGINIDPAILLAPEAEAAGRDPRRVVAGLSMEERQARLEALRATFLADITLLFDGRPVVPTVRFADFDAIDDPYDRALTGVILSGPVPPGAATFAWRSSPHLGVLVLVLRRQGGESSMEAVPAGGTSREHRLDGRAEPGRWRAFGEFLALGFTHILPHGPDHVLFVLGLFLGCLTVRHLLLQVTAFTLAHSLTLGLAWFGVVTLPGRFIETAIAASIAVIALENCGRAAGPSRWRPAVVFAFGLVHGLGFADILHEHRIEGADLATALVGFNLGVELAQLTVVGIAFLLVLSIRGQPWYRRRVVVPASLAIAATGLGWALWRLFS